MTATLYIAKYLEHAYKYEDLHPALNPRPFEHLIHLVWHSGADKLTSDHDHCYVIICTWNFVLFL